MTYTNAITADHVTPLTYPRMYYHLATLCWCNDNPDTNEYYQVAVEKDTKWFL